MNLNHIFNFPIFLLETIANDKHFLPICLGICTTEKANDFECMFSCTNYKIIIKDNVGAGREATWPTVQAAKKRPIHLTANDRDWPAKPRPTDGPTKKTKIFFGPSVGRPPHGFLKRFLADY
ncbi:hypothetical protein BpHYR1_030781 [Brachionus plicatilis]|uniref:Uncharacterized protein n=1 Tax=Brachionus plicatilis TaxID=10195 RepID=A0A3M7RJH0_BRAPC|nr:hypothetical protein BpHYR1_030781 [Brachionus plicatilis]